MSGENVASLFKSLSPGSKHLLDIIKGGLESEMFENPGIGIDFVVTNEDEQSYTIVDDDGVRWDGPDYRGAMLTVYVFMPENQENSLHVVVGLLVRDTPYANAGDLFIAIDNDTSHYIHQNQTWDKILEEWGNVWDMILDLINDDCFDEDSTTDDDVDMSDGCNESAPEEAYSAGVDATREGIDNMAM